MLALLLLDANRVVSVDRLVDGVWGDAPPSSALASLQNHLGAPTAGARRPARHAAAGLPAPRRRRRARPRPLPCGSSTTLTARSPRLRRSASPRHWRSGAGRRSPTSPASRPAARRRTSEELRLAALEERIEADLALGRHAALVPELEELVAREPYRERPRRQLIVALYRSGRQADALEAYTRARRAFVDELGTEPGRELQELHRAVLRRDPALDAPAGAGPPPARPPRAEERKTVTVLAADVTPDDLSDDPEARRAELRERSAAARERARDARRDRAEPRQRPLARRVRRSRGARRRRTAGRSRRCRAPVCRRAIGLATGRW